VKRKLVTIGAVAFCAVLSARAGANYSYDSDVAAERTLIVEVPENEEEAFDKSYFFPDGATVTNITKRGLGKLTFSSADDLSASSFSIRVEAGIYYIASKVNVGVLGAGAIDDLDRATFYNGGANGTEALGTEYAQRKLLRAAGEGHAGMGALIDYYAGGEYPFGHTELQDDTSITMGGPNEYILFRGDFDMGGRKLTINSTKATYFYHFLVSNPGDIDWFGVGSNAIGGLVDYQCFIAGSAANRLSLSNIVFVASSCYPAMGCNFDWTLRFGPQTSFRVEGGSYAGYGSGNTYNVWNGPVEIAGGVLPVSALADKGALSFGFMGKVTGGGLALNGSDTTRLSFYLGSGENDFTGGIVGRDVDLHLLNDGAAPQAGGVLALTNANVVLDRTDAAYRLPAVALDGTAAISGGKSVSFSTLKKSGTGTLSVASPFAGADTLEVHGGTMDLSGAITGNAAREKLSGLVCGDKEFASYSPSDDYSVIAYTVALNRWPLGTNEVVSGADKLYEATTTATGWQGGHVYSYEGYLWNNEETDVDFNFIGCSYSPWSFWVDGQMVMGCWCFYGALYLKEGYTDDMHWFGDYALKTVRLSPGPHHIRYITAPGSGETMFGMPYGYAFLNENGKYLSSGAGDLYENSGDGVRLLAFNTNGKATRDVRDYQKFIDPGDGSVVTWDVPPESGYAVHPVTHEVIRLARDSVRNLVCSGDATLALGSEVWSFETLEGFPDVGESGLSVSNTWTIDPVEFGAHELSTDGKLGFASGAKLVFKPGKPAREYRNGWFRIAEASGGVEGVPAVEAGQPWAVRVEGNVVYAKFN